MMKQNSLKKWLSIIGVLVLIAGLALMTTGCGSKQETPSTPAEPATTAPIVEATEPVEDEVAEVPSEQIILGQGDTSFALTVVDEDGSETAFLIQTNETTVGAALLGIDLLKGEDGPYGLYIHEVNGIRAVYEEDGSYWAFYEDGEYAMTGVDMTDINPDVVYSLVKTKD